MEIKASSVHDRRACKALARLSLAWRGPICIGLLVMGLIYATVQYFATPAPYNIVFPFLFLFVMVALVFILIRYARLPSIMYQQVGDLQDCTTYFLFTDDLVQAYTKSPTYEGRSKMLYTHFVRVKETKDYLFLFRSGQQTFFVDKASLAAGDLPRLRERLRAANIYTCDLRND